MQTRFCLLAVLAAGCNAAAPRAAAPAVVTVPTAPPQHAQAAASAADRQAVIDVASGSERAFLTRRDVQAALAHWSSDATGTRARQEQPGRYDITLSRSEVEAERHYVVDHYQPRKVAFRDIHVSVDGSKATLRWFATSSTDSASDVFGERYQLVRTALGWQITAFRYWPVSRMQDGKTMNFGPAWMRDADRRVAEARAGGDERDLLFALFSAYRFHEAYELASALTAKSDADAWTWQMLAVTCGVLGKATEAENALAKAAELGEKP